MGSSRFGDVDMVVVVVDPVIGLSPTPDEVDNLPRFRIRCFRSSRESHIVDGAVVETVDAEPSAWYGRSIF